MILTQILCEWNKSARAGKTAAFTQADAVRALRIAAPGRKFKFGANAA
jgi:hypothetical protein